MFTLTDHLQHISGKNQERCLRRSWRHCQHWRQNNLHFADDINGLAGEEEELAKLVEHLRKASSDYGMEISAKKTKLMTNNTSGINTEIKVNGQRFETVTSSNYLGWVIADEGSKPEMLSRIAQTTAALTRLKPDWNGRSISLSSKIWPMRSLVTSIFLYVCESWILTAEHQRRIQAMEMRCYSKILQISNNKDHFTNEEVHARSSRQSDHAKTFWPS